MSTPALLDGGRTLGEVLPLWSALPFIGMLLSIALAPTLAPRFWHHNYPKVALFWALSFIAPFVALFRGHALHEVVHIFVVDYVPFLVILIGLYSVTGGIVIRGRLAGTPLVNCGFLLVGAALASWIGTTGASALLIRPLLRANELRRNRAHVVVFFIFLVANIGGCLTPLGDPPLFLGFLRGVPFFWTLRLLPELLVVGGLVLATFFVVDSVMHRREIARGAIAHVPSTEPRGLEIDGVWNFALLAGIVVAVLGSGLWTSGSLDLAGIHVDISGLIRDAVILGLAAVSMTLTPKARRTENNFSWEPVREVAILFAGIFATIIPALAMLNAGEKGAFGPLVGLASTPARMFWLTGILSSFLDNAPTYLAFFTLGLGRSYAELDPSAGVARLIVERVPELAAISAGAVFMGACTYIGNAPNFMVKSIAEESGVEMPSFFGYIFKWTLPVLVPAFALATWLFH